MKIRDTTDLLRFGVMSTGVLLLMVVAIIVCCAMLFSSCRTERIVTVPEYHEHVVHQHDTLIQRDTIEKEKKTIIREVDSATMAEFGIKLEEAQRAWLVQTDELQREVSELRQHKTDTVVVRDSIPVVQVVEKPPNRWQKLSMRVGNTVLLLLLLTVTGGGVWLLLRLWLRR